MIKNAYAIPDPRNMDPSVWADFFMDIAEVTHRRLDPGEPWKPWASELAQSPELRSYNLPDPTNSPSFDEWASALLLSLTQ